LWGQEDYHFKPDFQETIADFYDGALRLVNFRADPDKAARAINAWVSEKTREKMRELVGQGDVKDARLVLTNAIYFKGRWEKEFEKSNTRQDKWYGPGGTIKVPTMHRMGEYGYCEGDNF
jgi:serpin B